MKIHIDHILRLILSIFYYELPNLKVKLLKYPCNLFKYHIYLFSKIPNMKKNLVRELYRFKKSSTQSVSCILLLVHFNDGISKWHSHSSIFSVYNLFSYYFFLSNWHFFHQLSYYTYSLLHLLLKFVQPLLFCLCIF